MRRDLRTGAKAKGYRSLRLSHQYQVPAKTIRRPVRTIRSAGKPPQIYPEGYYGPAGAGARLMRESGFQERPSDPKDAIFAAGGVATEGGIQPGDSPRLGERRVSGQVITCRRLENRTSSPGDGGRTAISYLSCAMIGRPTCCFRPLMTWLSTIVAAVEVAAYDWDNPGGANNRTSALRVSFG